MHSHRPIQLKWYLKHPSSEGAITIMACYWNLYRRGASFWQLHGGGGSREAWSLASTPEASIARRPCMVSKGWNL